MPVNPTTKSTVDPETGEIESDPFAVDGDGNPMPEGSFLPVSEVDFDDAFASLLRLVDREIVGWRPAAGDRIFGIVADIGTGESEFGEYPLIVIDSPQSEALVGIHCFHASLKRDIDNHLERKTLVIGSRIAISYHGLGQSTQGKSAPNIYRVGVLPPMAL